VVGREEEEAVVDVDDDCVSTMDETNPQTYAILQCNFLFSVEGVFMLVLMLGWY
jgi:hypothetical protein